MQNNNQSVTPHDDFFKLLMEVRENATEVIRAGFPERIIEKIDFTSLKRIDASFHSPAIGNYFADVLYECRYGEGQKALISLLFEHKSQREAYPHFQLLLYMSGIWLKQVRNRMTPRPIFPIIFYHGPNEWKSRSFTDYFLENQPDNSEIDEELKAFLPEFEYILINLQEKGDEWIRKQIQTESLRISMLVMRNIRSPQLLRLLPGLLEGAEKMLNSEHGRTNFKDIYVYLSKVSKLPNEKIREVMDSATFMNRPHPVGSSAWQLEQKGIARGKVEGKAEVASKMLRSGFDAEQVVELTGLEKSKIEELQEELS